MRSPLFLLASAVILAACGGSPSTNVEVRTTADESLHAPTLQSADRALLNVLFENYQLLNMATAEIRVQGWRVTLLPQSVLKGHKLASTHTRTFAMNINSASIILIGLRELNCNYPGYTCSITAVYQRDTDTMYIGLGRDGDPPQGRCWDVDVATNRVHQRSSCTNNSGN